MNLFGRQRYYGLQAMPAQETADVAQREARDAQFNVELMRADINRLLMITEGLWTLLKEKHGYTDEELAQAVQAIDAQDGVLDGKPPKASPKPCPQCRRMVAAHHTTCIYCGQTVPVDLFGR